MYLQVYLFMIINIFSHLILLLIIILVIMHNTKISKTYVYFLIVKDTLCLFSLTILRRGISYT